MKLDNIHYSLNKLLSYNKPFNFVISAREAGKSTAVWLYAYKKFKQGYTTLVIRRLIADITDTYVNDIESLLNKFLDKPVELEYRKGEIKDGALTVYIDGKMFFRVIALSNPLTRVKSLMMPKLNVILFDEFICNTRMGEKYLSNEVFKFKEIFNTFQREAENLRVIFSGNPYSLYNPYFSWMEADTKQLYPGNFVTGETYCIEVYQLTEALREHILKKNPLYKFDDSYTKYAFDGRAINDDQIQVIERQPEDFALRYVFYVQNKYLGIYSITSQGLEKVKDYKFPFFWLSIIDDYKSNRRQVACIDVNSLIEGNYLICNEDKKAFYHLKDMYRNRRVSFRTIEESYLFEEIFNYI